jgi:hypothetical protein
VPRSSRALLPHPPQRLPTRSTLPHVLRQLALVVEAVLLRPRMTEPRVQEPPLSLRPRRHLTPSSSRSSATRTASPADPAHALEQAPEPSQVTAAPSRAQPRGPHLRGLPDAEPHGRPAPAPTHEPPNATAAHHQPHHRSAPTTPARPATPTVHHACTETYGNYRTPPYKAEGRIASKTHMILIRALAPSSAHPPGGRRGVTRPELVRSNGLVVVGFGLGTGLRAWHRAYARHLALIYECQTPCQRKRLSTVRCVHWLRYAVNERERGKFCGCP